MLVNELVDDLLSYPSTCLVRVRIRKAEDGTDLYEFRDVEIDGVVVIQLDE